LRKRDELYVRFLQAGKDVEVLFDRHADPSETARAGQAAKVKDRVIDFDKLAQEVNLYASPQVSVSIDQLLEAWNAWRAGDDHERDHVRQEAKARYRTMFILMQPRLAPGKLKRPKLRNETFLKAALAPTPDITSLSALTAAYSAPESLTF
jgi:hypothetical protein